ncbi:MAG TPA: cytochrome c-type biogenesis protein [Alphaproteobacteria bacterium]|nr:cytochrome c-type biogenesis protein [Alphaproteobacteria bacterium]
MMRLLAFHLVVLLALLAAPVLAVQPSEMLADPRLEARARAISEELRCLVCQNQSIDESNADLAHDLRVLVRERLVAGDSDAQAVKYIVDRYGQFVLLKPPVEPATYVLWLSPALLVLFGAAGIFVYLRRRRAQLEPAALSAAEEAELKRLIEEGGP